MINIKIPSITLTSDKPNRYGRSPSYAGELVFDQNGRYEYNPPAIGSTLSPEDLRQIALWVEVLNNAMPRAIIEARAEFDALVNTPEILT